MQTIGDKLEEARKRKGISIREAAETTKIRGDYLQKFEANSFDLDLPPLYIRGFLRSYARYLDLDPERVVGDFNTVLAEGKPMRRETREVYGRVDFADAARNQEGGEAAPANRSAQDQALMLKFGLLGGGAIIVIVIIVLLINVLFSRSGAKSSAAQQTVSQVAQPREATLTVTAVDSTRVKVAYSDDSVVFLDGKFPMNRGEMKPIRYTKELLITIEHPERIRMELNGRAVAVPAEVKPMGQFRVPFEAPQ